MLNFAVCAHIQKSSLPECFHKNFKNRLVTLEAHGNPVNAPRNPG